MITINKKLLENFRFSDHPNAWVLEAEGFRHSAELLMQAIQRKPRPKFISTLEANLNQLCYKNACYLYSISIELFLKALYSAAKTPEEDTTEKFNHDLFSLNKKLVTKGALKENELNEKILGLAHVILAWFGRYYKPLTNNTEKVINTWFEEVPDEPDMVKAKFTVNSETANELKNMATLLSSKVPTNPGSMDALIFSPF